MVHQCSVIPRLKEVDAVQIGDVDSPKCKKEEQ